MPNTNSNVQQSRLQTHGPSGCTAELITMRGAGALALLCATRVSGHPLCFFDDRPTDSDQVLRFCPEAQDGACCNDLEEDMVEAWFDNVGPFITGDCKELYTEVRPVAALAPLHLGCVMVCCSTAPRITAAAAAVCSCCGSFVLFLSLCTPLLQSVVSFMRTNAHTGSRIVLKRVRV